MANKAHQAIFDQGVQTWNQWRKDNPDIKPDLQDVEDVWGFDINPWGGAYSRLNITLFGERLVGLAPSWERQFYQNIDLHEANLAYAKLTLADLEGADFREANLNEAYLINANLTGAKLSNANLTGAKSDHVCLAEADLSGADLSGADLTRADLSGADLTRANLSGANLTEANLNSANLTEANLYNANLNGAKLTKTDIRKANLSQTNLRNADFSEAIVSNTTFSNIDLNRVIGLDTVQHQGRSSVGVDTLEHSKGNIPEVFLRGCGLSDWQIEAAKLYSPGLTSDEITPIVYEVHRLYVENPIQYYSCFISYSSKDKFFAQWLHNSLQNKGVRCWFAPEDMKIGDKIRPTIDQSIRVHDKLLIILSENSLNSEWVESEVEKAFEEERKRKQTVLFPVRLDEAVMETEESWAAEIRRTRHIGDFSRWKDHDAYQVAFEHLLRDLKAEG